MVQAYAQELLNQKDADSVRDPSRHPLYAATRRLMDALNRLEDRLEQSPPPEQLVEDDRQEQLVFFERENESLRQERENLSTAITQLKRQYDDLHKVAGTIYNKLDDSIRRLTKIIEE